MTRERKLAIEMWINIRNMLSASDKPVVRDVLLYKETFCEEHRLRWSWNCWFCQYINCCDKCPLGNCLPGSDYSNVKNDSLDKDVRIAACNNIIRALGGEG